MNMKNKTIVTIIIAYLMVTQVAAATLTLPGTEKVKLTLDSYGYVVNLPLEVYLQKDKEKKGNYIGLYTVSAKGLIEDQNVLMIAPEEKIKLSDTMGNEAIAKTTQHNTVWRNNPKDEELSIIGNECANGQIRISKLPEPGEYKGTLYFDIEVMEDLN